jgi:hypothetical protein
MSLPTPTVPVSWGELLDKIAILEIKAERIADMGKQANVRHELAALAAVRDAALVPDASLADLLAELKGVNERLWEIEDEIREAEQALDFGPDFIALARAVYHTNDRRAALKRAINSRLDSALVEEKSYAALAA